MATLSRTPHLTRLHASIHGSTFGSIGSKKSIKRHGSHQTKEARSRRLRAVIAWVRGWFDLGLELWNTTVCAAYCCCKFKVDAEPSMHAKFEAAWQAGQGTERHSSSESAASFVLTAALTPGAKKSCRSLDQSCCCSKSRPVGDVSFCIMWLFLWKAISTRRPRVGELLVRSWQQVTRALDRKGLRSCRRDG